MSTSLHFIYIELIFILAILHTNIFGIPLSHMALSDYRWGGAACVCMHGVSASMCLCERGIEARWWGHSMTCDDYGGGAKDDVRE